MNETKLAVVTGLLGLIIGAVLVMTTGGASGEITQPQGDYPMDSGCYGSTR